MNTPHWDTMAPGQQNAWIAEHVFKLHVEHWTVNEDGVSEVWELRTGYVLPDVSGSPYVAHYVTDMTAAWHILAWAKTLTIYQQPRFDIALSTQQMTAWRALPKSTAKSNRLLVGVSSGRPLYHFDLWAITTPGMICKAAWEVPQ